MRLTDLLQLINDLNINTAFYLKIDDKIVPWGKLTLVDGRCLLYPGKNAMTKAKLIRLVGHMHSSGPRRTSYFRIANQRRKQSNYPYLKRLRSFLIIAFFILLNFILTNIAFSTCKIPSTFFIVTSQFLIIFWII